MDETLKYVIIFTREVLFLQKIGRKYHFDTDEAQFRYRKIHRIRFTGRREMHNIDDSEIHLCPLK